MTQDAKALANVDKLEVWCATCQKNMKHITGLNYVSGWYECDADSSHAVIIAALESASSPSTLIAAVEAVELRIAERSNDDNLPAVTGLLDAEDEWFIKLLRAAPTEEVA